LTDGIAIVGAGGWGTALAVMLARAGRRVTLLARRTEQAKRLSERRLNEEYLPGITLPPTVKVTADTEEALVQRHVLLAVPSQSLRETWIRLIPLLRSTHTVANAAKGLEIASGMRLSQVLEALPSPVDPGRLAVLSGPNHAEEVGRGQPTTSVVASRSPETAEVWQDLLMTPTFRVYTNDDLIGVELGAALKNVIAIGAGICDGLGFGDNTKAALLTRGLAEMSRLGVAMGARALTFSGLSGMGDLIATCTSRHSRNARAGRAIGSGEPVEAVIAATSMVIEGIPTCKAAIGLAHKAGVEMPITEAVGEVLFNGKEPRIAVAELMGRGPKDERGAILGS